MLCVLLLLLLLPMVMLKLLLMVLGASGDVGVLIGEDAYDPGGDFVVDDGLVVFTYDIDAEFLLGLIRTRKHLSGVRISDLQLYHLI
jgi:hypothetical protein